MSRRPPIPDAVPAGFATSLPNPKSRPTLDALLVARPATTFLMRCPNALGRTHEGDLLIVDRALAPLRGDHVLVGTSEGLVLRRFPVWRPEPGAFVWGVVTSAIQVLRRG
jgi:hypothetical protein